jgi:hypothetical protein
VHLNLHVDRLSEGLVLPLEDRPQEEITLGLLEGCVGHLDRANVEDGTPKGWHAIHLTQ